MNGATLTGLHAILRGRCALVGVGNALRGDDGLGPAFVEALPPRNGWLKIDAGTTPENYVQKVVAFRPESVLLIDAVDMGQPPGTCALLTPEELGPGGLSTHDIPLFMTIEYIEAQSGARVAVLAVQPGDTAFGQALTPPVQAAIKRACAAIARR